MKKGFWTRVVVNSAAIFFVARYLSNGLFIDNVVTALVAGLVFGIVNSIIRPLLLLLSLPLTIVTLGLFTLVINASMLQLTDALVRGMSLSGFWNAMWVSLLISIVSMVINNVFVSKK